MDKGTRKREKETWENIFFENSFYLIQFRCGLVPYHHTKFAAGYAAVPEIKISDLPQTGTFFGKFAYATFVICS